MSVPSHIFREYDVRGVVERDLTDETVSVLGRAFGTWLRRRGIARATLGGDCRLSSGRFMDLVAAGMQACGVEILDVGTVPTPLLYFSMFDQDVDAGVMVTGSHNPKDFNGFKLCADRTAIYGEAIQEVRRIAESGDFETGDAPRTRIDVLPAYRRRLVSDARLGPRRPRIVVDAGNGTGGVVAVPLLRDLGFDVVPLFCEMDGNFPNHHPDPTVPDNLADLQREVLRRRADLGIAFDGDADRLGIVTEDGAIVYGDMILLTLARGLLATEPGAEIISEVKCSRVLFDQIAKAGGRPLMYKVGHSLIKAKMAEDGALLGGEMSGHIFFRHRWYGFDDAIYSALRYLEILSASEGTASELLADVPTTFTTPEIRVDCPDEDKVEVVARMRDGFRERGLAVNDVDGARVDFGGGWGLVRASNTQPILVLRFEADSAEELERIHRDTVAEAERVMSLVRRGR